MRILTKIKIFHMLGPLKILTENPKFWPVGLVVCDLAVRLSDDEKWVSDDSKRDYGDIKPQPNAFRPLPRKVSKFKNY